MNNVATAVALSMYRDLIPLDDITQATGLTENELADAIAKYFDLDAPVLTYPADTQVNENTGLQSHLAKAS